MGKLTITLFQIKKSLTCNALIKIFAEAFEAFNLFFLRIVSLKI